MFTAAQFFYFDYLKSEHNFKVKNFGKQIFFEENAEIFSLFKCSHIILKKMEIDFAEIKLKKKLFPPTSIFKVTR